MDGTPDLQLLHRSMEIIVGVAERVLLKKCCCQSFESYIGIEKLSEPPRSWLLDGL